MIRTVIISALLTASFVFPVHAEDAKVMSMKHKKASTLPTLEQRFDACMGDPDCAPAERIGLLVKTSSELQKSAEIMKQHCIDKNFKSCVGAKSPGTLKWYRMYSYLGEIADSLEGSSLSELSEPTLPPEDRNIEPQWPSWHQVYNQ